MHRRRPRGREERALLEAVPPHRCESLGLVPRQLQVELHAQPVQPQIVEGLVDLDRVGVELAGPMAEPQVGLEVELDDVHPGLDRRLERREGVFGRDGSPHRGGRSRTDVRILATDSCPSIAYNPGVAEPRSPLSSSTSRPAVDDDPPSLDPLAIELAYRRERARRRARVERRSEARRSNVRFWISLLVLTFLSAFLILAAWHEVQTLFGV